METPRAACSGTSNSNGTKVMAASLAQRDCGALERIAAHYRGREALETVWPICRAFSFSRASNRRAHTNSAASALSPRKITSHPGPGVKIITTPHAINVKPTIATIKRRACRTVSIRNLLTDYQPSMWLRAKLQFANFP
jgi:hypothetical protein